MALEQIGLAAVLDDKNFQAGLKRYTSGLGQMTKLTDSAANVLSGAFVAATGLAVAGIGAVVAASKIGLDATLQWAEGLDKLGDQFGMSGEVASGWQFLMNKVGLSVDEGAQGLNYFTNQLGGFGKTMKDGTQQVTPFSTALQKLGVSAIDVTTGKLKTFDQIMPQIMDQFEKLPAGIDASALAMDLFGARGGTKFLDFLRQGGAGLKDATARVKELGLVLSTDDVNAAEEFGFALNELNLGLLGVKNTIGRAVLPVAKQFVEWLNRHAIPPLVDLAKRYVPLFTRALETLGGALGDLTSGRGLSALFRFYFLLEDTFGKTTAQKIYGILSALGGLKDFIVNQIVPVAQRLWGAFQAGGLAGLGGQIARELQKAWPAISAQLRTWAGQFWDWLTGPGGALEQAGAQLGKMGGAIQNWAQENGPKLFAGLQGLASDFWFWLWGPEGALARTGVQLEKIMFAMKIWIENHANMQPVWDALGGWVSQFWGWLTDPSGGVLALISENMGKLATNIENWTKDPGTQARFREMGRTLARAVIDGIGNLFEDRGEGNNLIVILFNNLWNAGLSNLRSFMNLGRALSEGIMAGIFSIFTDPVTAQNLAQAITTMEQNAVNAVISQLSAILQPLFTAIQTLISTFWASHPPAAPAPYSPLPSGVSQFQRGGWVPQTGMALVHRGEYVIPARQAQNISNNNSRTIMPGAIVFQIQGGSNLTEKQLENVAYRVVARVMEAA